MKTCKECNLEKNEEAFPIKGKNSKGGRIYEPICRVCVHIKKLPYTVELPLNTKICIICNHIKDNNEFFKSKSKCKPCYSQERKDSYIYKEKEIIEFKICTKCTTEKHIEDFSNKRISSGNYTKNTWCKTCENKERGDRAKAKRLNVIKDDVYYFNLERIKALSKDYRRPNRVKKYGITVEDLDRMELEQNNKCYLCNKEAIHNSFGTLVIDHSHVTNKVRKLLCSACNALLGAAKDSPEFLRKCASYIEDFS